MRPLIEDFPSQFKGKPKIEALCACFDRQFAEIEQCFQQLLFLLPVSTVKNVIQIVAPHVYSDFFHMIFHIIHAGYLSSQYFREFPPAPDSVEIFFPFFQKNLIECLL